MFKVRAVVVAFLGDKEKYPCHHQYNLGDEFIFDGASFSGSICPSLAIDVVPKMMDLHAAGPRYRDYLFYYPFLYAPKSVDAPELKKYDGLGFKNVFEDYAEPKYSMANLAGSSAFKWPPPSTRTAMRDVAITCPDYRTSVRVKIEAFDLSDQGRNLPYFRREMVILDKVAAKPGIQVSAVLAEFTPQQIEGIYPALSPIMVQVLLEEMELMGYVEMREDRAFPTAKTGPKLREFKNGLSNEDRGALNI
jgi:uncharacterized repeat protein (TIGR04076 family)